MNFMQETAEGILKGGKRNEKNQIDNCHSYGTGTCDATICMCITNNRIGKRQLMLTVNDEASADVTATEPTAGETATTDETESDYKGAIAVVFATGGLGDKTYNDSLYYGVKDICDTMNLKFDYSEPMDAAEYEPLLRGYADTGEYDLIISLGYSQGSSVEAVAPNYPDQNFMLIDSEIDVPECRLLLLARK